VAPRLQQQAMAGPPSVEHQVSAQRSIGNSFQPPYSMEDHEQLQVKVQELEEWQAKHQEQIRAKEEEAQRISEQYRFEHARLQAQHDAAAALAKEEQGAQEQLAAVSRPLSHACSADAVRGRWCLR
jgi:hypothetical protein